MRYLTPLWIGMLAALCCCASANADCIGKFHSKKESPIYEVVSCGPAEPVIELLRKATPARFGTYSYAESDVVITVRPVNDDARKLTREATEYWYYSSGCAEIREGMRLRKPELKELCCDVWPVSSLACGVGMQLMTLERGTLSSGTTMRAP